MEVCGAMRINNRRTAPSLGGKRIGYLGEKHDMWTEVWMINSFTGALALRKGEGREKSPREQKGVWIGKEIGIIQHQKEIQYVDERKEGRAREKARMWRVNSCCPNWVTFERKRGGGVCPMWHQNNRWPLGLWVTLTLGCVKERSLCIEWLLDAF